MWIIPWLLVLFVSSLLGCAQSTVGPDRPISWAAPMRIEGLAHIYKITDYLYRSEEPTAEGVKNLEKIGIKTIIDLGVFHSDWDEIKGTGLRVEKLRVKAWHIEDEDVVRVLRIIRKRENGPFLIHCWRGGDRVGVMVAMFRIIEQGWTKEEAIREMVHGGYRYNLVWINIIRYVKRVDIEKIRKELEK
jgi:protein tyrosine/serine phosphatase